MSYDDRDWVGELLSSPTKAEVETQFALPDLSDTVQGLSAMDAFKEFLDYAKRAAGLQFSHALYRALERELYITNEKIRDNGQHYYPLPTELQLTDQSKRVQHALSARIAPLLPAIREYVSQRLRDPAIVNRLAWLADQVEVVLVQDYPPRSLPRMGCVEWRALKKGILVIIATLPQPDPSPTTGTTATQGTTDRLKWKSSTAAFVHIFNTLAAGGYFDLPTKGGKGNDPNTAAFARMLLQAFDVPGKDGNPITSEVLRVRLSDGAPGQLAEAKAAKFQIPDAGALIVPNAGELE